MTEIIVDTGKLAEYSGRLSAASKKLNSLDNRIDNLYWRYGLFGLQCRGVKNELAKAANTIKRKDVTYIKQTINEFEMVEKTLAKLDPLNFRMPSESIDKTDIKRIIKKAFKKYFEKCKKVASVALTLMTPKGRIAFGKAVIKKASQVVSTVAKKTKQVASSLIKSYTEKGWVYQAVQYGKAVIKAAKGIKKIALGVGSLIGSGGLSTPVSVLMIISGCNDFYNSIIDGAYVATKQYDEVGKHNWLKDKLKEGGSAIGSYFGNEKVGEFIGNATYYGIDLVTSFASLKESYSKLSELKKINWGHLGEDIKGIGSIDVMKLMRASDETIRYNLKLAEYSDGIGNFVKTTKALYNVGEKAVKVGKAIDKILIPSSSWKNPVVKVIDSVSDIKSKIGKGAKIVTKATKLVFG